MVCIEINDITHNTIVSTLIFLEKYFTQQGIAHKKILYAFQDKWQNICSDSKPEIIHNPLYLLSPYVPEYNFVWNECSYTLRVRLLDEHHLYKSMDNPSVFIPMFSLIFEIDGTDPEPINRLIIQATKYSLKWETHQTAEKEIVIYHWVDDFWDKLNTVEKRGLDTIYLPEHQVEQIQNDLDKFLSPDAKKIYSNFGVPYHRTYCLHGPPGTGKSSLILALVSHCQKNIGVFSFSRKTDDQSFVRAINTVPKNTVLLLEDIDCLLGERQDKSSQITFSTLLNCLDGLQAKNGLIIFITTNFFMKLDPAFCRPGRIDYIVEFKHVTRQQVFQMLGKFFPDQSQDFERFYGEIRHLQLTTCLLQKYLFERYPHQSIFKDIKLLRQDIDTRRMEPSKHEFYG